MLEADQQKIRLLARLNEHSGEPITVEYLDSANDLVHGRLISVDSFFLCWNDEAGEEAFTPWTAVANLWIGHIQKPELPEEGSHMEVDVGTTTAQFSG